VVRLSAGASGPSIGARMRRDGVFDPQPPKPVQPSKATRRAQTAQHCGQRQEFGVARSYWARVTIVMNAAVRGKEFGGGEWRRGLRQWLDVQSSRLRCNDKDLVSGPEAVGGC